MAHRLLILGTMEEFIQLVQKAKQRGIYTIICDGYPSGPARRYADEDYVIPVDHIQEIADLCKEKGVDHIITSFSDFLLECMVKIAAKADIPCYLAPEQLCWYRDKSATKELLTDLGLPSPAFRCVKLNQILESADCGDTFCGLRFPMVTKPLDKYGSRGIYVTHNLKELQDAAQSTAKFCENGEILLEEYNDGFEFNMMTWVLDGEVHVLSIADREKTPIDKCEIPISTRNVYPSRLYDLVASPAKDLLQQFIGRTGQKNGALSMQFFWSPKRGIQVCEIAARFFGYEHDLTDIVFGLNIEDLLLNSLYDPTALKGMLSHHHPDQPKQHGAVLYFQGRLLTIADQSTARELASHPSVQSSMIFYRDGERVVPHANPYVALYYVAAPTRAQLDRLTQEFFDKMSITDPEGTEVLYTNQMPVYP